MQYNAAPPPNGFILIEQTQQAVDLRCEFVERFFLSDNDDDDLKLETVKEREKINTLATMLARLEARVEYFDFLYGGNSVKLAFLHAQELPLIFENKEGLPQQEQSWNVFFELFFELDVPHGEPRTARTTESPKKTEKETMRECAATDELFRSLKSAMPKVAGLLFPNYESLEVKRDLLYPIEKAFRFNDKFQMFLRQTGVGSTWYNNANEWGEGCVLSSSSSPSSLVYGFVAQLWRPDWPPLKTPAVVSVPLSSAVSCAFFLFSESGKLQQQHNKPATTTTATSSALTQKGEKAVKEAVEEEEKKVLDDSQSTAAAQEKELPLSKEEGEKGVKVKDCLPRLYALFLQQRFAPFQMGGMIKSERPKQALNKHLV